MNGVQNMLSVVDNRIPIMLTPEAIARVWAMSDYTFKQGASLVSKPLNLADRASVTRTQQLLEEIMQACNDALETVERGKSGTVEKL